MNCDKARLLVDAYMDSELDSQSKVMMTEHLATCAGCAAMLESRRNLSRAIKRAAFHVPAPAGLGDQFRRAEKQRRKFRFGPLALGTAFAVGMAATLMLWRPWALSSGRIVADMMEDHERAVMGSHLVDVASTNPIKLHSWFCTKGVEYYPAVKDFQSVGYTLVGGRLDMAGGRPVCALVYKHEDHLIDVFVTTSEMPDRLDVDRNGFHVRTWEDCGLNYWAVSDDAPSSLADLGHLFTPRR